MARLENESHFLKTIFLIPCSLSQAKRVGVWLAFLVFRYDRPCNSELLSLIISATHDTFDNVVKTLALFPLSLFPLHAIKPTTFAFIFYCHPPSPKLIRLDIKGGSRGVAFDSVDSGGNTPQPTLRP